MAWRVAVRLGAGCCVCGSGGAPGGWPNAVGQGCHEQWRFSPTTPIPCQPTFHPPSAGRPTPPTRPATHCLQAGTPPGDVPAPHPAAVLQT